MSISFNFLHRGDNSATGHVLVESEEGLEKFGKRSTVDAFKTAVVLQVISECFLEFSYTSIKSIGCRVTAELEVPRRSTSHQRMQHRVSVSKACRECLQTAGKICNSKVFEIKYKDFSLQDLYFLRKITYKNFAKVCY